jgi:hypothetical protein
MNNARFFHDDIKDLPVAVGSIILAGGGRLLLFLVLFLHVVLTLSRVVVSIGTTGCAEAALVVVGCDAKDFVLSSDSLLDDDEVPAAMMFIDPSRAIIPSPGGLQRQAQPRT